MKVLEFNTVESSELVEQTFRFWFSDQGHIRSPFPNYIHNDLKGTATERFFQWASGLKPDAKDELNDEMVGEKFEELIFETALGLIKTEDERITVLYPFLPRLADQLSDDQGRQSMIVDRNLVKEGDHSFLEIKCEVVASGEKWSTRFELPV